VTRGAIKAGVGAVVFRGEEVLLIRRGKAPFKGLWSIPGGGIEFGERLLDALRREVREETACEIDILGLIDIFEAIPANETGDPEAHYLMIDYVARWRSGEPVAGDDAVEAIFTPYPDAMKRLEWDKTRRALERAHAIHRGAAQMLGSPL